MPTDNQQKLDGFVSVTEILSYFEEPELVQWKLKTGLKESNRISRMTAKTGSRVHELIYSNWQKGDYKLLKADNSEVRSCMEAWDRFKLDYAPNILKAEFEVRHEGMKIIGHADMLATCNKETTLIDIKTAGSIKPKHWVQLAGYWSLLGDLSVDSVAILRLDRNIGVYEFEVRKPQPELFWALAQVYDFYTERNVPMAQGDSNANSPTTKEV